MQDIYVTRAIYLNIYLLSTYSNYSNLIIKNSIRTAISATTRNNIIVGTKYELLNPKYYPLVKVYHLKIQKDDQGRIAIFNQIIYVGETTSIIKHIFHYKTYWKAEI